MPELHVLRVFCGEEGGGGNSLGVFLEGGEVRAVERQGIATELGFSDAIGVWAWANEGAGIVRERVFCPRYGIDEDEATGSAAITLSASLGRELQIRQGKGSLILARPLADGMVEIGGRVELDEVRQFPAAP
jgi:predicted PhzF superfamily epimerase YddE/YHI9